MTFIEAISTENMEFLMIQRISMVANRRAMRRFPCRAPSSDSLLKVDEDPLERALDLLLH